VTVEEMEEKVYLRAFILQHNATISSLTFYLPCCCCCEWGAI